MMPDEFWTKIKNVQRIHQRLYDSGKGWIVGWMRRSAGDMNTPLTPNSRADPNSSIIQGLTRMALR